MKQKIILSLAGLAMVGSMLVPAVSTADTSTSSAQISSITSLLQQIKALQDQIDALKSNQKTLQTQTSTQVCAFINNLTLGSKGDDVVALQTFLASLPGIYPNGKATGVFGKDTEKALKKFQKENGLEQAGHFGPKTRELLNKLVKSKHGDKDCRGDIKELMKIIKDDKHATSTDYMVPMLNVINSTSTATTTAYVFWTTNKNTTSTFWYSTSTPLNINTANKTLDNSFSMSHSVNLSGLTASTTYYYLIKVTDNKGVSATSTERTLNTL